MSARSPLPQTKRSALFAVAALAFVFVLPSCTLRFISEYDPVLDAETTELHQQLEGFLFNMEAKAGTPEGTYERNRGFYEGAKAQLSVLTLRAEVQPKSELMVRHYALLGDNLEQLAKLHSVSGEKGLHSTLLGPTREAFRMQFRAIMKLHAALRRGAQA